MTPLEKAMTDMTPSRFLRQHLQGVKDLTLLAKDDTSWLIGIEFKSGRREMAIVYHPSVYGQWKVKVGTDDYNPARDGCVADPAPSPIERLLGKRRKDKNGE